MLVVKIYKNNELLDQREAINISEKRGFIYGKGRQIYETFDNGKDLGIEIENNFEDGYWKLAIELCKVGELTFLCNHIFEPTGKYTSECKFCKVQKSEG